MSKGGIVYPFTGIRGDSKELWARIKAKKEKHVELIRADSQAEQSYHMGQSDIVIVATGYSTNQVPIYDNLGNRIPLVNSDHFRERNEQHNYMNSLGSTPPPVDTIQSKTQTHIINPKNINFATGTVSPV